jgi:hypothetical protein
MSEFILLITVALLQLFAIGIHAYALSFEKKYCSHCEWWSDIGAYLFILFSFIPIIGIFVSLAGCADYMRNVVEELNKDRTASTIKIEIINE